MPQHPCDIHIVPREVYAIAPSAHNYPTAPTFSMHTSAAVFDTQLAVTATVIALNMHIWASYLVKCQE